MIVPALLSFSVDIGTGGEYPKKLKEDVTPLVWHAPVRPAPLSNTPSVSLDLEDEEAIMREQLAEERAALFARKFAGHNSAELTARLEIINSKLEQLAPRVTAAAVSALERFTDELAEIRNDFVSLEQEFQE